MWLSSHLGQCMMAATTWEAFVIAVNELIFRLLRGWGYILSGSMRWHCRLRQEKWLGRISLQNGQKKFLLATPSKRRATVKCLVRWNGKGLSWIKPRRRLPKDIATIMMAQNFIRHQFLERGLQLRGLLSSRQILLTIQKQVKQLDLSLLLLFRQQHRRQNRRLWPNQRPKWKQKQRLQHQSLNQRPRLQWCQLCRSMVAKNVTSKMAAKNVAISGLATRSHGVGKLAPETLCDLVGKSGCGVLRCVRSDAFRSGCFHMLNGLGERPWSMMWGVCVGGKKPPLKAWLIAHSSQVVVQ